MMREKQVLNKMPTVDEVAAVLDYDPESGIFRWKVGHRAKSKSGMVAGKVNTRGYLIISLFRWPQRAHRLAWLLSYGKWPDEFVDHINQNPSDNRLANLRLADNSQNMHNTGVLANSPFGVKGVQRSESKKRFVAKIRAKSKAKYLGTFDTIDEAAHAYNKAAIRLHSEFAVLNPIGSEK